MHARLADQRAPALDRRLDVRRGHVLARGVDDQLLLAVDDLHEAVVVDLGDVAGVQPAVGVERLGGLLRLVAVAEHHELAADEQLAVLGRASPRRRAMADRPCRSSPAPGRLQVPKPQVSDIPHSSASSIPTAWKNSSTSTGVGAAPTLTDSTWSSPSISRSLEKICSSASATWRLELLGHRLAALAQPHPLDRRPRSPPGSARAAPRAARPASSPGRPSASPRSAARRRTSSGGPAAGTTAPRGGSDRW